jgi:hypothetical protein
MPRQPSVFTMAFPFNGIHEGSGYELQPEGTTVDAQNVRPFPASSPDTASTLNSESSGRARGGQRPGLTKYLDTAHDTTQTRRIQDINHLAWSDLTPMSGKGHAIMNESTDGSFLLVDPDGAQVGSDGGVSTEVFNLSVWGRDGFGYIATLDAAHKLIVRQINKKGTVSLDWTNANSPTVQLTSETRQVRGMVVVGNILYIWVKNISGVNGEAIYRMSTSTGNLLDAASGGGTQSDFWIVSQNQSTANFQHFYPSSGYDDKPINLMTETDGVIGILCFNDSAPSGSADTVTASIAYNAAATGSSGNSVQEKLVALSHLDANKIAVSGGPLGTSPVTIEFQEDLQLQDIVLPTVADSGGSSVAVAVSQQGSSRTNKKITLTQSGGAGTFTISHNARVSLQLIDVETGEQILCKELQVYSPDATPTDTNQELDISSDGLGNFYCLTRSVSTFAVTKVSKFGVQAWQQTNTGTSRSLSYDPVNSRLGICGGNVYGTGSSVGWVTNLDTGALAGNRDAHSVTNWNVIRADDKGGFRLFKNASSDNVARITEAATPADDWLKTHGAGTSSHTGSSCAAAYSLNPQNSTSKRQTVRIAVSGGVVKEFDELEWTSVASGGDLTTPALERNVPVIFSAQLGTNLFFTDGRSTKYYKATTRAITTWTPTSGTLPIDSASKRPTLIENWRGRIVMSGIEADPAEWYMSKVGDAFDWNYAPDTITETQAVSGVNSPAGQAPDVIRCIIPVTDDILIFGCDHSIWQMSGDPMLGGRLDLVADGVGTPWGRPWCRDSGASYYVFGTRGGVYRGTPGQGVQKITEGRMEERMSSINLDTNLIRLAWNEREKGVHVLVTPLETGATSSEHYFYCSRTNSWWIDKFAGASSHDSRAVHVFDGDSSGDRAILMGGADGYIRKWDVDATDDDGTAISSHVYLGPIVPRSLGTVNVNEIRALLAKGSSDVTMSVFRGNSAEDAYNQTSALYTSTFKAGRNVSERRRVQGHAVYLKLANTTVSQSWSMELLQAVFSETSGRFGRVFY